MNREPPRLLTSAEIDAYHRDGGVKLSGMLDADWLQLMADAVQEVTAARSMIGQFTSNYDKGYASDVFMWKTNDKFRELALFSPLGLIAQQLFASKEVHFFYDQMFVKEPGSQYPTAWHQDLSFWPVAGDQICSMWIALDPVNRESSALELIRGSHKWPQRFGATVAPDVGSSQVFASDLPQAPDVEAQRQNYDVMSFDFEPGDMLIFHSLTLHGSRGNASLVQRRRAVSLRYAGDDAVFENRPATMPLLWEHGLQPLEPLHGHLFPRVYPTVVSEEIAARMADPELPSKRLPQRTPAA